jgi:hypothetical protein
MLSDRLKNRLTRERPMVAVNLQLPADVVQSMQAIAPLHGFSDYQTLLKSYISEGLRRDEAQYASGSTARLIEALRKRGVPESLIAEAEQESHAA